MPTLYPSPEDRASGTTVAQRPKEPPGGRSEANTERSSLR